MPMCEFNVDGDICHIPLDRVPRKDEYEGIFPDGNSIQLVRWWYSEEKPLQVGIAKWPIHSDAAGCHPSQIGAMKAKVPFLNYTRDGKAIFESPSHRRRCLKALGMVDRRSYY